MTQQQFEELLSWFDPKDRERAGEKYETVRHSLIKILTWGGCIDAEDMADETFNRVAARVEELKRTYEGDPALYFYGVARMLMKECRRRNQTQVPPDEAGEPAAPPPAEDEDAEDDLGRESECLRRCLDGLSPRDRELILAYYTKDKQAKIDHRKELARRLGIVSNALRVRVYRIRLALEDCIERCLRESAPDEMD
jgi:RNA polymerase sigma factor (sigma-70 family)